jgi:hypothetical protein
MAKGRFLLIDSITTSLDPYHFFPLKRVDVGRAVDCCFVL